MLFAGEMPMTLAMMRLTSDGRVELPLALAALAGEVPHEIFVGVAEDVVMLGAVLREIQLRLLEDGDKVGKALHLGRPLAEFIRVVEVRKIGTGEARIGVDERLDHLRIDLVADVAVALEGDHVLEAGPLRNRDRRGEIVRVAVFVGDVLDEQHEQDVVLVLAGIHATAQFIARGPKRRVEVGFLEGHAYVILRCKPGRRRIIAHQSRFGTNSVLGRMGSVADLRRLFVRLCRPS